MFVGLFNGAFYAGWSYFVNLILVVNGREEDGRYCCEVCWILLNVWRFEVMQLWCQFEVKSKEFWLWWILLGLLVLRLVGRQDFELGMV